jgi:transcriptional regulator with XRE-family HTH domain
LVPQTIVVRPIWEIFLLSESEQREQDLVILGQAVRWMRDQQGLSTSQLAAAANVEAQRIAALEAGRLDPTYELLLALAQGLGVQPSALIACAEDIGARWARRGAREGRPPELG